MYITSYSIRIVLLSRYVNIYDTMAPMSELAADQLALQVDADNCYDRIAHPMLSMILQAFDVPTNAVKSMLSTIQDMKFFLRTGYGDSEGYWEDI